MIGSAGRDGRFSFGVYMASDGVDRLVQTHPDSRRLFELQRRRRVKL
jgi:hypothetical protein